ncbi:cryptochrome-1-like [Sinocyclocheilus anshuiensis]|uniref:cryptochrome-1-like n=1 Tax=Sinocyclocheilus anshuiensis TaxID=1608454 RepID=UPI0007B86696|nr:PREDICTED: cryptochrome-1-like [Sinocyclocheilus anshuiensis]
MAPNSIHWFRKGLRLHDNPALQEAVRGADTVRCVYFLDPWFAGLSNLGVNRWRISPWNVDLPLWWKDNTRLCRLQCAFQRSRSHKGLSSTAFDFSCNFDGAVSSCPFSETHTGFKKLEGFDIEGLPSAVWPGGETEALTRIERHLERKAWVANFERPRMNANSLLASPTGLSPYLRFGCLSCRLFYFKLTDLYRKVKKTSTPPLSLYGQLLWREFFYTAATNNPRFDKMEGNPICVRIPWDKNPDALAKWAEAKTGFPWIDAIMTQLRQEGWIHHLARHAVACFLTRGDLWISWEEGMKVFEELLLDADWSVNAGSWMWLSCSSFFQQFFHCYCPVGFGRRTDPNGDFIRRYLPILRGFPAKYIYDPWNAPDSVQAAAKCIIGVHYPKPMVNHAEASRLNIERMKQIYQQLSRYRGLGLLASVPSTHNGNGNGMAYSPGEQQSGTNTPAPAVSGGSSGKRSGSILLKFDSEKQQGPSGIQQQQQQQSGYHHMTDTGHSSRIYKCNVSHDMTGPQHSAGHLLHSGGSVTGKRARESERDLDSEDDTLSTSHKLQRQIAEVTSVHSGKQSSMKS